VDGTSTARLHPLGKRDIPSKRHRRPRGCPCDPHPGRHVPRGRATQCQRARSRKIFPLSHTAAHQWSGGADDDVDGSRFRCSGQGPRVRQRGREGGHPRAKPADASAILLRPATAAGWTRLSAPRPPLFVSPGARGLLASLSHRLGFPGARAHAAFAGTGLRAS
jgi:hypothetical protein